MREKITFSGQTSVDDTQLVTLYMRASRRRALLMKKAFISTSHTELVILSLGGASGIRLQVGCTAMLRIPEWTLNVDLKEWAGLKASSSCFICPSPFSGFYFNSVGELHTLSESTEHQLSELRHCVRHQFMRNLSREVEISGLHFSAQVWWAWMAWSTSAP